jgi:thiol:disulfide interchange protein DsbD
LLLAALAMSACAPWASAADLLGPEQAFRPSARLVEPALVEIRYDIADGYYLYRDKFAFRLGGSAAGLGKPEIPRGKVKRDEFFGTVETFRGHVVIRVPLAQAAQGVVALEAVSQGCADVGICYPPQAQALRVAAAGGSSLPVQQAPRKSGASLLAQLEQAPRPAPPSPADGDFLPVDQAFKVEARMPDARTVVVRFSPAQGYYLYRDKLTFAVDAAAAIESMQLPPGEVKKDPNFGDTEVFHQGFQAVLRLKASQDGKPFALTVGYQGCSEKGLCYPPEKKTFPLAFRVAGSGAPAGGPPAGATTPAAGDVQSSALADDARIATLLGSGSFWLVIASFLGFGLLLSLTPCMWPMIPILSGIIAGQGVTVTRARGLLLSSVYVLGMALAYAIAGVAAGMTGTLLSSALQNPWVLGAFALVFVLLALSMFGLYELQLPASWQGRLSMTSNRMQGGRLAGVFAMGVLSAVIVGPCVAAPLAGALLYISQSRDVLLGGSALFAMAVGMGIPLLAIGTSAGALLPRAGAWMASVKTVFGVLLLATAIWILSSVISPAMQMLMWGALLVVCAVYLRAIDALPPGAGGWRMLGKGFGLLALLLGVVMLVGAAGGGRDVLRPLSGLFAGGAAAPASAPTAFARIASVAELDAAVAGAGRPVMLDFYADWCVSCKEMEHFTFRDEGVRRRFDSMLLLQADVTANSDQDKALLARFGLFGPPGIIFFDRQGREIRDIRVIGFQPAERFKAALDAVLAR